MVYYRIGLYYIRKSFHPCKQCISKTFPPGWSRRELRHFRCIGQPEGNLYYLSELRTREEKVFNFFFSFSSWFQAESYNFYRIFYCLLPNFHAQVRIFTFLPSFSGGRKFFRKEVKFSNCVEAEFYHLMNIIDYQ